MAGLVSAPDTRILCGIGLKEALGEFRARILEPQPLISPLSHRLHSASRLPQAAAASLKAGLFFLPSCPLRRSTVTSDTTYSKVPLPHQSGVAWSGHRGAVKERRVGGCAN